MHDVPIKNILYDVANLSIKNNSFKYIEHVSLQLSELIENYSK